MKRKLAEALLSSRALTAYGDVPGGELIVSMQHDGAFALTQRPHNHRDVYPSYESLLADAVTRMHIDMATLAEQDVWENPYDRMPTSAPNRTARSS